MPAPHTRRTPPMSSREWTRRVTASLTAATEELRAREQLRQAMAEAGYPADRCIADLAAGHPLPVVMRRHGFRPAARSASGTPPTGCPTWSRPRCSRRRSLSG